MSKRAITTILLLVLLIASFGYLLRNAEKVLVISEVSPWALVLLSVLSYGVLLLNAYQFKFIASLFQIHLTFTEWFGLTVANTMWNYVTPARGGIIARALYMKKKHAFTFSEYVSLVAGSSYIGYLVASIMALVLGTVLTAMGQPYLAIVVIAAVVVVLLGILAVTIRYLDPSRLPIPSQRLRGIAENISKGLRAFTSNRRLIPSIVCFGFGLMLLAALRLYCTYYALGIEVSFFKVLLLQAFLSMSLVIPITPGNLGLREGVVGLCAGMLDLSLDQALLGALTDRFAAMFVIFLFGFIYSKRLLALLEEE